MSKDLFCGLPGKKRRSECDCSLQTAKIKKKKKVKLQPQTDAADSLALLFKLLSSDDIRDQSVAPVQRMLDLESGRYIASR